ncbi:MAG: hypothetical protein IPN32_31120 [Deltaproteobacteria bacterium]|nr:hypothetical protein [Deltaproteobacteria bacterium]
MAGAALFRARRLQRRAAERELCGGLIALGFADVQLVGRRVVGGRERARGRKLGSATPSAARAPASSAVRAATPASAIASASSKGWAWSRTSGSPACTTSPTSTSTASMVAVTAAATW